MLPKLAKNGFKGQIFTTFATADLCNIMLRDSAHIQEFEAEWRNRKGRRAGKPEFEPVYVMQDALDAIELLVPCGYCLLYTSLLHDGVSCGRVCGQSLYRFMGTFK